MNRIEYAAKASRTLPDLGNILNQLTDNGITVAQGEIYKKVSDKLNLSHMMLGLSSEIGELVNCTGTELKNKIDIPNLREELGDLEWYLANYCNLRDITPPIELDRNQISEDRCFELLISSVGELVNVVKRFVAYDKEIDKSVELTHVYDVYTALDLFQKVYQLDGSEIRDINIAKLVKRYPKFFSNEQALNRDLTAERNILEGN
jgi:NTP pyrophosphatase (non-canonical NTP hydrolase)